MPESSRLKEKIQQRDFKLNALLEITKAINANLPVSELLGQYETILHDQLGIDKLILFTRQENWTCLLQYGMANSDIPDIKDEKFFAQKNDLVLATREGKESFDLTIPVYHDEQPIAYLLVGDRSEQEIRMSPVIKHMKFIQTLTNVLVVAIQNKSLYEENLKQERVKKELELAAEMQAVLLPQKLPRNEHFEVSAVYRAHEQVGGDYYDFMELNDSEVMFCMADVSGKGVSAAFLMANFQAYLRAIFSYHKSELTQMVTELNRCVMESALGEKYITLFLGVFNRQTRKLNYVNCGHNPPVLADSRGYTQLLKLGTIGLGMFDELPALAYGELALEPNTTIVCFTDGLVETENEQKEEFSTERLEQIILANYTSSLHELNKTILQRLNEFKGEMPYMDDLALLSCRFY